MSRQGSRRGSDARLVRAARQAVDADQDRAVVLWAVAERWGEVEADRAAIGRPQQHALVRDIVNAAEVGQRRPDGREMTVRSAQDNARRAKAHPLPSIGNDV